MKYAHEFEQIGIPVPKFAVIHDSEVLKMRFNHVKQSARPNFMNPKREAFYMKDRIQGYLLLTAHQPELYRQIRSYGEKEISRLNPGGKKAKFTSYEEILRKWYKPKKELLWAAQAVNMKPMLAASFEAGLDSFLYSLNQFALSMPSAELSVPNEAAPIARTSQYYELFEEHSWCCFVDEHKRAPTKEELQHCIRASPFCQFTNIDLWYDNHADHFPVEGPEFDFVKDVATWRVVIYTMVYLSTHEAVNQLQKIPFGGIVAGLIRLYTTALPRLFSQFSYVYYLGKGESSAFISSLMPKDPFVHHKRIACHICEMTPRPELLAFFPVKEVLNFVAGCADKLADLATLEIASSSPKGVSDWSDPWMITANEVVNALKSSSVVLTAPCGTGKTKFMPNLLHVLMNKPVLVVFPRRILCEDWAAKAGATYKQKGVLKNTPLMCCTYGYLQKITELSTPEWIHNYQIIFDEAHEESEEWTLLLHNFVPKVKALLMTATPSKQLDTFPRIESKQPPLFPVEIVERRVENLDQFVLECTEKFARVLVIIPSKRKGLALVNRLRNTMVNVVHVHSGNRVIPNTGHVVATAVVDAGITIPGCDCVIDTGISFYNDGGQLIELPSSPSTATQRAGRTGRTCPGVVFRLREPREPKYRRVCSLENALKGGLAPAHFGVTSLLERNNNLPSCMRVTGDLYGRFKINPSGLNSQLSLYHKLKLGGNEESRYVSLKNGALSDDLFLLEECGVRLSELPHLREMKENYRLYFPHYKQGTETSQNILMKDAVIQMGSCY